MTQNTCAECRHANKDGDYFGGLLILAALVYAVVVIAINVWPIRDKKNINVGGVIVERKSFRLRCRVGLHRWQLFAMAPSYIETFPDQRPHVSRMCIDCRALMSCEQRRDGSQHWIGRL